MKVEFKNSRGLKLVGVLDEVGDKIIIMAHGFTGDKDEHGRFVKTAEGFVNAGFSVLRFDFAGSGESDETGISVSGQVEDLKAAIEYVKSKGYKTIGLMGHSLGGLTSLIAYSEDVKTMALWAPVTEGKKPRLQIDEERQKLLDEQGYFMLKANKNEFKVTKQYIEERLAFKQETISNVKCPVLIIHGDKDALVPLEHSKSALNHLKHAMLKVIEGGDHGLYEQLDEVISLSVEWFKEHL